MPTIDIPRDQWREFLDTFSLQHRAWLATIDSPGSAPEEPRPLGAVRSQPPGGRVTAIEVSFTDAAPAVRVENPAALRVQQTDEGADQALEIIDADGGRTRVGFRATALPDMLDGLAPGEQPD